MFAAAAATGILSLYGTPAFADSFAGGGAEDSPGVLSGNNVQAPVHIPVNVCGNTITAVGAFNGAYDNTCVNGSSSGHGHGHERSAGAHAEGGTKGSPGVGAGNNVQAPIHLPVNACGNGVHVVSLFGETSGNTCVNGSHGGGHDGSHEAADRSSDSAHGHSSYGHSSYGDSSYGDSSYGESSGAHAEGAAHGSPGAIAGNEIDLPLGIPVNACGNSVDVLGLFGDAYGNTCVNDAGYGYGEEDVPEKETPEPPAKEKTPPAPGAEEPPAEEPPAAEEHGNPPHMAETGSEGMIAASAAGAVLITGGAMLYRRGRLAARR